MLSHYIIVRRDLPIGIMCAMVAHAAGESAAWNTSLITESTRAIILQAKNEDHLEKIRGYLIGENIPHVRIVESTGPYAHQLMSIGIVPVEQTLVQDKLSDFTLLNGCLELDKLEGEW